jgi:hypothetical protein
MLPSGWSIKASTQNAETFNVIIEGKDWAYYATSVRSDTTKYTVNNGAANISTANTNMDGTGTLGSVLTSNGSNLLNVTIKATGDTTEGIIRLFLYDGTNTKLLVEIPVVAADQTANYPSFARKVVFQGGFSLKSGWVLKAATARAESFNVIAEALDISYPA